MFIKINLVYADGTKETVDAGQIDELLRLKKIAAIQCGEGWLEIRRNQIVGFTTKFVGTEKRESRTE